MLRVGDRVETVHGHGVIKYAMIGEDDYLVAHDRTFAGGHDGDGGCEMYNLPTLPEFDRKCIWLSEGCIAFISREECLSLQGRRVRCIHRHDSNANIEGELGTCLSDGNYICVEFDNNIEGHTGAGKGKDGHCWNIPREYVVEIIAPEDIIAKVEATVSLD